MASCLKAVLQSKRIVATNLMTSAASQELSTRFVALTEEAWAFVAHDKVENLARQFLSVVPSIVQSGQWEVALFLAREIAFMTPSQQGSTAFDRLARSMKARSTEDIAAVALLRRSQFLIGQIGHDRLVDFATGQTRPLVPSPSSEHRDGATVIGRFTAIPDGRMVSTGMLLELDNQAQEVARGFVRPGGKGIANALRCAEAVFRHVVRRGTASLPEPEPSSPFDPASNPLDALAADWAALDGEPDAADQVRVRDLIGTTPLVHALISVTVALDIGDKRLSAAYRRIAAAILEFMAAREANGSMHGGLDQATAEIEVAIRAGWCGSETRALFVDLRARAEMAARGKPGTTGGDLDKLVARIKALRAKTVEQGCTEQEALAAAEKVAELLDRYGLSLSELDLRQQVCEGIGVETGRKRRGPIDDCMGTIAAFFDSRVWAEMAADGMIRYIFFGLPADVQAAVYLYDLIALAFGSETGTYQRGAFYGSLVSGQRRSATNSFQAGLAQGIIGKLESLRRARDSSGSNGRDLVPIKQAIVDQELERLGLSLQRTSSTRRRVIVDAFEAGQEAGKKFEYRQGLQQR